VDDCEAEAESFNITSQIVVRPPGSVLSPIGCGASKNSALLLMIKVGRVRRRNLSEVRDALGKLQFGLNLSPIHGIRRLIPPVLVETELRNASNMNIGPAV
jgi:hypothetical protein